MSHPIFDLIREELCSGLFERIETALMNGKGLRGACAEAVADTALAASSFDAAVKQAERIWRSYKSRGLQVEDVKAAVDEFAKQVKPHTEEFMQALTDCMRIVHGK